MRRTRRVIKKPSCKKVEKMEEEPVQEPTKEVDKMDILKSYEELLHLLYCNQDDFDLTDKEKDVLNNKIENILIETVQEQPKGLCTVTEQIAPIIREKYNDLLQKLTKEDKEIKLMNFSKEEKQILNERADKWLEYFLAAAAFSNNDENFSLYDYLENFIKTQNFIN